MSDWQPIDTMPRDGTRFLVDDGRYTRIAWVEPIDRLDPGLVYVPGWGTMRVTDFTHWMPLPAPPTATVKMQPADPNTAYHRIPAPGQRVRIFFENRHDGEILKSIVCSDAASYSALVKTEGYPGGEWIDGKYLVPIGDNPRFILVPAE